MMEMHKLPIQKVEWYDTDKGTSRYGFKIIHPKLGWITAGDCKGPIIFDLEKYRDDFLELWRENNLDAEDLIEWRLKHKHAGI